MAHARDPIETETAETPRRAVVEGGESELGRYDRNLAEIRSS